MIQSFFSKLRGTNRQNSRPSVRARRARVEQLEDRRLLSITSVTDVAGLRAALDTFNGTSDDDTINVAAGTYTLSGARLDNANASGDLDLTKAGGSLTIQGAGAGSTFIDANDVDRVLHITGATTVTLADLTLRNGATDDDGTTSGQALGGGILISGAADVTLTNVAVTSNTATGVAGVSNGSAGQDAYGGGIAIANAGASLTLTDTSMTGNGIVGGAGQAGTAGGSWSNGGTGGQGGAARGGAVYVANGDVTVAGTSSLTGNSATGGSGGTGGQGGFTTFAGWIGGTGGAGGTASGGGLFVSGGSLSVPTSGAITSNTTIGGQGGDGGAGGTSMSTGPQGVGGAGGSANGGGAYFTDGDMAAIQSGAIASNSVTGGVGGSGSSAGGVGSTSDTDSGRQASTLSVTVEQAGGQTDPGGSSPVNYTVTFSESVSNFATGDVSISGNTGADTAVVTGSGTTYNVAVSGITSNGWLSIYLGAGVATNAGAAPNAASFSDDNVVQFSDTTGPTLDSTTPTDDATGVDPTADLSITFDENVAKGTGNISIYDSTDTLFEAIDVTSGQVTVSGVTVTINPTGTLADLTSYYVQIDATAIDDTVGNSFVGISDKTTWSFTTADTTGPTISSTIPADDATAVNPTADLSITFDENVANGTGSISIYDSSDTLFEAIDVTTGQVTASGATVTINPTGTLADLTSYYVQIDGTAIDDTSSNSFAGISDKTTWSFTTADTTGPTISSTVPADDATGVTPSADLSVTFDENVAKGTGNISIYDSSDTLFEAIDVTGGQVTIAGATVTINPTGTLADLTSYYVQIDATAIDDTVGNSFAGISDKTTWSFTTADTTEPTIDSTTPTDDATGVAPTADLSITFNENVAKGTGDLSIYDSSDTLFESIDVTSGQVTVSGATVTINPTGTLADVTSYYVQIDATAIDDMSSNSFAGISDKTTWSFTTADTTAPMIDSTVPADDATGVDPTANLSVAFDENVAKGTGNISIYDSSDTLFEAIDVTSGQVTVSGTTVAITPTGTLALGTSYYVQIDATAIDDTSGNSFAGIADKTTWNFATIDYFTDISAALTGVWESSVAWGDYDNDGDLDVLLTGLGSGRVSKIYRNDGSDTFTDISASLSDVANSAVAWGDYDADGDLDVLLTGNGGSGYVAKIYRNDGSDTFTDISASLTGVVYPSVAWGDYDNDGDLDILLTGYDGSDHVSKIYRNDGSDTFTDISASLAGVYSSAVAWGDYDSDGDLDILLTGQDASSNRISKVYRNDGSDTFTDIGASLTGVSAPSASWGDYDNDGDLDILLAGDGGSSRVSKIYRNDGSSTFTDINASLSAVSVCSVAWGDFDNDGDLDVLLTGYDGSDSVSKIYRNDGSNTFTDISASLTGVTNSSAAWGDYDNDGDLDILLAGYGGSAAVSKIYRNNSVIANTAPAAPTGLNVAAGSSDSEKVFSWNAATDTQTAQNGLSYNLYVGTASGDDDLAPAMADLSGGSSDGLRRIATIGPKQGTSWTVTGLTASTFYWSVQAVDTALAGSAWAAEGMVSEDATAPTIDSTVPANDATAVDPTADLSITFDENVAKGTGNISIYDSSNTLFEAIDVTSGQATVSGATVTINPTSALADLTGYYVQVDATAIDDTAGNSFGGIADTTTWSFTTADTTGPTIDSTVPADDATDVDPAADLSITFNENVAKGTGNISIYDSSDTLFEAIDVTSGQVTVSDATVTINPTGTLADLTGYYVQFDATAIEDNSGNAFAGIGDKTTWSFTTGVAIQATDLGAIDYRQLSDRDARAGAYYVFETTYAGQLSLVMESSSTGTTSLELLDDSGSSLATDATRIDRDVAAGETYYFQLTGTATVADVAIVNLVDDRTGGVVVHGTSGDDDFVFMPIETTAITGYLVAINDVEYQLQPDWVTSIVFDGLAGNDTADLTGTSANDHVLLSPTSAVLTADAFTATVTSAESIAVAGGAGTADVAELTDSAGDDVFTGVASDSTMVGTGYRNAVTGFEYTHAYAKGGGNDTANLEDTDGDDLLMAEANTTTPVAKLIDSQGFVRTKFFDVTQVSAVNGGTDEATFTDSAGDDHFAGGPGLSTMTTDACTQSAIGFEVVHAYALSGGSDVAELYDSAGDDTLVATDQYMKLYGDGFFVRAKRFDAAHAYARNGGNDTARMYGTAGNETFTGTNAWAKMVGPATIQRVKFFGNVTAYGKNGTDKAYLYDSPGDDVLTSSATSVTLTAPTSKNIVQDFESVRATSENGGSDYDRTEAVDFALEAVGDWIREIDEPTTTTTRSGRATR
jgi:methionine-rich copper-binding protein CopC